MHNPQQFVPSLSFFDDASVLAYQLWKKNVPLKRPSENRIIEGHLFKRSKRTGFWKSRYYVLFDDRMAYFKNPREYKETGYCLITNVKLELINKEDDYEDRYKKGFRLVHNGQYCELFARAQDIHDKWIKALSRFCVLSWYTTLYTDVKPIGKGSFAKVYLARRRTDGAEFAVKTFHKALLVAKDKAKSSLINEINIMRKLQHEGIIALEEVHESDQHIHLVLELLHGGELFERIIKKGSYSERDACTLMQKLLTALEYMHHKNIMHRDLKPENLILKDTHNDYNIKIADFGLAAFTNTSDFLFKRCGTPGYVAPEVLEDMRYDQRVDVFSAGVILYILLTGRSPFPGLSYHDLLRKNMNCEITFNFKDWGCKVSDSAIDLMKKMLSKNPEYRCTVTEALQHDWITGGGSFLSPRSKAPVYLNSALENMKRFQQEDRFNVKNIKPKDLDKPIMGLERSGHAPSPLINGKVNTILDTKSSFGFNSPMSTMRSPRDSSRMTARDEKIVERADEHDLDDSADMDGVQEGEGVFCERNAARQDLKKYSNAIAFPSLSRYTNPTKVMGGPFLQPAPAVQTTINPQATKKKAINVQGNLLKMLGETSHPSQTQQTHQINPIQPVQSTQPTYQVQSSQPTYQTQSSQPPYQMQSSQPIQSIQPTYQTTSSQPPYQMQSSQPIMQSTYQLPSAQPMQSTYQIQSPKPIQPMQPTYIFQSPKQTYNQPIVHQQIQPQPMHQLFQMQAPILEKKATNNAINTSITSRTQRKRDPLMNFLKPFQ